MKISLSATCACCPPSFQAAPLRKVGSSFSPAPCRSRRTQLDPSLTLLSSRLNRPPISPPLLPPVHSFERVHKAMRLTSNVQIQCPCYPPAISHLQVTIIDGSRAVTPQQPIPAVESNHAFGWLRKYFLPAFSNRKRRERNQENKCSLFQVFSLSELVTELSIILGCFMFCDKIWVKGN